MMTWNYKNTDPETRSAIRFCKEWLAGSAKEGGQSTRREEWPRLDYTYPTGEHADMGGGSVQATQILCA